MSFAPASKLIAMLDSPDIECPDLLSSGQVVRIFWVIGVVCFAIALFSAPAAFGS